MPLSHAVTWNSAMAHSGHVVDHEEGGDGDDSAEAEGGHVHLGTQLQGGGGEGRGGGEGGVLESYCCTD